MKRELVRLQIHVLFLLERIGKVFDNRIVKVFTAKESVAIGRFHFEHAVTNLEDRDVKRAAAEVIDGDSLTIILFHAISERSSSRLVDDAQNFKSCDLAGILGCLALGIVKVSRDSDHGLSDCLTQITFRRLFHLLQDKGADLRGGVLLPAGFNPSIAILAFDDVIGDDLAVLLGQRIIKASADQALDCEQGVVRIGDSLTLGRLTDQTLIFLGECHNRRRGARTFRIFDDFGLAPIHDRDARIGCAKVNTDNFRHNSPFHFKRLDTALGLCHKWPKRTAAQSVDTLRRRYRCGFAWHKGTTALDFAGNSKGDYT